MARHLMLLSMSVGLLLLVTGPLHHLRQAWGKAIVVATPTASPVLTSPRAHDTKLQVDLSDRQVRVYRNGKETARYPVAVGQAGWETPSGQFKIHQMRHNPIWQHPITKKVIASGPDNPLGRRWIGFYQGEHMAIGFHGTPQESLVGQAVSHGCLRMRNRDIAAMYQQVGLGTVVEVQN
ncbi:L,D-transpeptidase [Romeriopsis navalis]|nr:L,D-transpeptidase [Romeriopsis navalis]